ncbi:MAG TPA: N-acetyl-1-D-myo-inositol-2-amino-2-deoxy-alpha-D-glucopyranoside deacetylase [Actinomycetales bacterium]
MPDGDDVPAAPPGAGRTGSGGLLLVHAHPDDESLTTGATMARYAAHGVPVTLVTCTLGQRGEISAPDLAHLTPDELGEHRRGELAAAMRALGVADHRLLGGGRWRDSGMVWLRPGIAGVAPDADPRSFALAGLDECAASLLEVIADVRPRAVVTYDPNGGYGHPDHVQAHRVTMRAVELAAQRGSGPDRAYWIRTPRSTALRERATLLRRRPSWMGARALDDPLPPVVADDDVVTTVVDGSAHVGAKRAALRAHRSQLRVEDDAFALTDGVAQRLSGIEGFQLVRGPLDRGDDLLS